MDSKHVISYNNEVLKVELIGRLDASNSEGLQAELKQFTGKKVVKLIFVAKDLEYISSAGLRVIIFTKQKVGVDAHIYLAGASADILNVIKMSGLDNFMTIQDTCTE